MSHSAPQGRIGKLLGTGQQVAAMAAVAAVAMRQSTKELINKSNARVFISLVIIQWIVHMIVSLVCLAIQ